jgi:predicted ATPase
VWLVGLAPVSNPSLVSAAAGALGLKLSGERISLKPSLGRSKDWSYDLLPEEEKILLGRLAIFRGPFTIDAAAAVAIDEQITAADALEGVANLAGKSLIATNISAETTFHRLVDTTRFYALEKL